MKRLAWLLPAVCLALPISQARAANTHVQTPSTWKLNLGESDFGGGPSMKSDQMMVTTDTEKWLKFSGTEIDGDGKTYHYSWSGPQDGTMKPMNGMAGTQASFKASDDTSHWVYPDGTTSDTKFSLSSDKKKAIFDADVKTKDGKTFHQKLVYDRVR